MKRKYKSILSEITDPTQDPELFTGADPTSADFQTWKQFVDFLIEKNAEIPYIMFIIYIGGVADSLPKKDGALDFNKIFAKHPRLDQFHTALRDIISRAFESGTTFYAGGGDGKDGMNPALYTILDDKTYGSMTAVYYAKIMKNLLKSYIGQQLSPDELIITTGGNAGNGGKEIYGKLIANPGTKALGSKYAINHPNDGGGKIEFIDPYDFDFFSFVSYLPSFALTTPHSVEESKNPKPFSTFYSIDGRGVAERDDAKLAGSLATAIDAYAKKKKQLPGFPFDSSEEAQAVVAKKVEKIAAARKKKQKEQQNESITMTVSQLNKLITELLDIT